MSADELSPETLAEIERVLLPGVGTHALTHAALLLFEVAFTLGESDLYAELKEEIAALPFLTGDAAHVLSDWVNDTAPVLRSVLRSRGVGSLYPLVALPCCGGISVRAFFVDDPDAEIM